MKVVYIAGPYRAPTQWQREQNIFKAREVGVMVARLGAMPLIPHSNTAHMDGIADDQFWLDGTLELCRRCDALVTVLGWKDSSGAQNEVKEIYALGKPVFHSQDQLSMLDFAQWLYYAE
ncbi:MAG: DUF1937 family protein [Parcubacteria group bacterium]